jgi:UDP-N-acetyl-D-mannosaminuronic acid dehydrogenase
MEKLDVLKQKVQDRTAVLGVIGLGYVGLPVACMFAQAGFSVIGLDVKQERIGLINQGVSPIEGKEPGLVELLAEVVQAGRLRATLDYRQLEGADVVLIDVETPVDEDNRPRYTALRAACCSLGPVMKDGALVVVESTIAPGTIDGVVRPLLEESSGKVCGRDFYLGACPERVMPGKLLANLRHMSRVCGGSSPEVSDVMVALYRHIVEADLDTADPVTAELTKTAENAYRDVNIAFANELALICEAAGADFLRVRELVNKSPGRNVLLAGAGVGGHCIPKDPWLLAYGAGGKVPVRLIPAARAVNDGMPAHMVELTAEALAASGRDLQGARIAVLGYAYLEDSDDTRNSPSAAFVEQIKGRGAQVVIHDPWVEGYQGDVRDCLRGSDAAVLMVAHQSYRALKPEDFKELLRLPVLVDGRRLFDAGAARAAGLIYRGVGEGVIDKS